VRRIRNRLDFHSSDDKKEFWQRTFIFTTRGTPLNKAQVKYLEARLLELAKSSGLSNLKNHQTPKIPVLSEADQAAMEGYMDELLTILPVLGISFFEPSETIVVNKIIYYLEGPGYSAKGTETNAGFLVMKDSIARLKEVPSMKSHIPSNYDLRKKLIKKGVLQKSEDGLRFTRNWDFNSPSSAAAVCSGKSANGLTDWKDQHNTSLRDSRQKSK